MAGAVTIANLTDAQAVLGCVGLSIADVSEERLVTSNLEDDLTLRLMRKLPNYEVLVTAGDDPAATTEQKLIAKAIRNVAKWIGAALVVKRWLYFKQLMSDGKTRHDRFDRMDLTKLQANVEGELATAWSLLNNLLPSDGKLTTTVLNVMGKATPTINPITDFET